MTTIAKLTKQQDGRLVGTLTTLALHVAKIAFVPEQSDNDVPEQSDNDVPEQSDNDVPEQSDNENAPDYRVFAGDFEIGAGWKKTSKAGKPYTSVKLDDPSFAAPIFCALIRAEDSLYLLDWNRRVPRRQSKAAGADETEF